MSSGATGPQTRRCAGPCGQVLPLTQFGRKAKYALGRDYRCRDCVKIPATVVIRDAKLCTGPCGRVKPITEFGRRSAAPDGRYHLCNDCRHAADAAKRRRQGQPHRRRWDQDAPARLCPGCGEVKLRDEYTTNANNTDGLGTWCRACTSRSGWDSLPRRAQRARAAAARDRVAERRAQVETLQAAGLTRPQIAAALGVPLGTVSHDITALLKLGADPVVRVGSARSRAKLSEAIVAGCRSRRAAGETAAALAREYGVSPDTMRDAISGQTWKHVTTPPVAPGWVRAA